MSASLFPRLAAPDDGEAIRLGEATLGYTELARAAAAIAATVRSHRRVAIWATVSLETCVAAVGAISAGTTIVPVNPKSGSLELQHIVADSEPELILAAPTDELPSALRDLPRVDVSLAPVGNAGPLPDALADDDPAIVLYTSGTTGNPKGALIPRRAIVSNLDALAEIWGWTDRDRLVHALPLFHVHGLVLGVFGPLRRGGQLELVAPFSTGAIADAFGRGATMHFGVPTMYHRIVQDAERDPFVASAFGSARLLVSGSAALPSTEHKRIERSTGQKIVERYGMTETLMNAGVHVSEERRPGYVGRALPGVEIKLLDDAGRELETSDDQTIGEMAVRGPNVFLGYLNRPDATAEVLRDGWFLTGDLATRAPNGYLRIVGRRATDLIKSAGFKIGAGEIEAALLEHVAVDEAAVAGRPDPDLGERIEAWVVLAPGGEATPEELTAHVGSLLASHKRPRRVHLVSELPRNAMGKVVKAKLGEPEVAAT